MKTIFIILMLSLMTACTTEPPVDLTPKSYGDNKDPTWVKITDEAGNVRYEYCDSNFCANSIQEYDWWYNQMQQKVEGF